MDRFRLAQKLKAPFVMRLMIIVEALDLTLTPTPNGLEFTV